MEAKKWLHAAIFSFILVGMFTNLFIRDPNDEQHANNGKQKDLNDQWNKQDYISTTYLWLKNTVSSLRLGVWRFYDDEVTASVSEQPERPQRIVISPNLSTCHKAPELLYPLDPPVNCCPPAPESGEPFIDFEYPEPTSSLRVRRPAHLNEEYIVKYQKALTIMKSLPYDDPRSFKRQADIHCLYCTGAYNNQYSKSSLMIHRSWLFFPWHRMMIYFHERILAKLIDDDTFSLSFWNWDVPEGMVMPDMYMNEPFVDKQREDSHVRPPQIVNLNYDYLVDNTTPPEEQIASNLAFMYNQMVSGAKKVELFMGCTYKPGNDAHCDGPGTIESAPHNTLHFYVGSKSNQYRQNMGCFYAAARDPLFYAHHSNIDRLWEVWKELRGYEPEIVDPDWLDSSFFFHNENSQLVRIRIRDVLNITKLRYSYEKVNLPWLNSRPKPSIDPRIARRTLNMRNNVYQEDQLSDFGPKGRTLDATTTVKVQRPMRDRRTEKEKEEELVLVVYGIDVKEDVYVKFDVYVNAIDAARIGPESREFAGTFVNVPRGVTLVLNDGDEGMNTKSNLKLGITELLEDLEAGEDESIWVTLVPRGGTGTNISVDGIRIEHMI